MEADPAALFFPDDAQVDLYGTLALDKSASPEDIRKAYRRLSLLHHPDKVATRPVDEQEAAKATFQRVGFAYSVLSDEKRRARYDKTGRTEEGALDVEPDGGWDAYFAELWDGEVNAQTLTDFFDSYEDSVEELDDLTAAYLASQGDIEYILAHVPARDNTTAEAHLTERLQAAIDKGELKSTSKWTKSMKDNKSRAKRQKAAEREAKEAEAAAKELGVHEKLFSGSKNKGKNAADVDDGEEALKALIQQRGAARMDALIGNLESKYAGKEKRKASSKRDESDSKKSRVEPDEADFLRVREEVDARRRAGRKKG